MASLAGRDLALARTALAAVAEVSPVDGYPALECWRRVTEGLENDEAAFLPSALGELVPLLVRHRERIRILLDIFTTFDLFEAVPSLLQQLRRSPSVDLAICAAALVVNPGVVPDDRAGLQQIVAHMELDERDRSAIATRLDPNVQPASESLARLRSQLWPGTRIAGPEKGLAPMVVFDEAGDQPAARWRLFADLVEAGAVVRRLPAVWHQEPTSGWLSQSMVILSSSVQDTAVRLAQIVPGLTVDRIVWADPTPSRIVRERLVRRVDAALIGPRLRLPSASADLPDFLGRDSYQLGSFDSGEMLYMAGSRASTLKRLRDDLPPKQLRSGLYWSFNQLVALRTWEVWRQETGRTRLPSDVLRGLVAFQGADTPTQVAVTSLGRVLIGGADGFVDWESGQVVSADFIRLDKVFEPQTLGGDRSAPRLPDPSSFTHMHPALLGGTPCVDGFRIPAKTIAILAGDGASQVERVRSVYPEIPEPAILDAISVGGQMLRRV